MTKKVIIITNGFYETEIVSILQLEKQIKDFNKNNDSLIVSYKEVKK